MQDELDLLLSDANGADDLDNLASESLAPSESTKPPTIPKPSKPSLNFGNGILQEIQTQGKQLKESIEQRKKADAEIPKENLWNEIMKRTADASTNLSEILPTEEIDKIGMTLISSYCSLEATAQKLGMSTARLKWLITNVPELEVYYEIAHEGIKTFTDSEIIKRLRAGDDDILKLVFNKLYAGRNKGGYNPSEIGTYGYNSKLGKQLAAETEKDRGKGNIHVEFNFVQKEIGNREVGTVEGELILDADEEGLDSL